MIDLNKVLTFSEAASKWGFSDGNTLRKAVERGKFEEHEIRKSGNVWLTTYEAMIRVFGEPDNIQFMIAYDQIVEIATNCYKCNLSFIEETRDIYVKATSILEKNGQVALVESMKHKHMIVRIFTDQDDLKSWFQYFHKRIKKHE